MTEPPKGRDVVLVIDDSPETLSFLTEALEQAGSTVLVATDGAQALSLVERITPDIILMDAVMPGMDGFETCRRLKANGAVSHVPVIMMTGLSETEHVIRGFDAGGVDYVTKPIVPDVLIARIRAHLANARAAQSARAALDTAGRYLLAADRAGRVLWCTPQAVKLLGATLPTRDGSFVLPDGLRAWLAAGSDRTAEGTATLSSASGGPQLHFSFIGKVGNGEFLFRLTTSDVDGQTAAIRRGLALTAREAEVLLWVARGKSNRDIGDILGLSPRTVNKHLEGIFTKLGVENRASAAAIAVRVLEA
jgi:DNA-binding NarL/FixJ family response regulator